jgi:hypothetical protein
MALDTGDIYRWRGGVYLKEGSGGGGAESYTHTQNTASDVWTVAHNLNRLFVDVQAVENGTGSMLIGDVAYTGANTLTITFAAPKQGVAVIRR